MISNIAAQNSNIIFVKGDLYSGKIALYFNGWNKINFMKKLDYAYEK